MKPKNYRGPRLLKAFKMHPVDQEYQKDKVLIRKTAQNATFFVGGKRFSMNTADF